MTMAGRQIARLSLAQHLLRCRAGGRAPPRRKRGADQEIGDTREKERKNATLKTLRGVAPDEPIAASARRISWASIVGLLLLLLVTPIRAAETHVKAELLSDRSVIKTGEAFTIGVLLHIDPGWHVYWINPGDSGLATSVKWKLPGGFTADAIQFPTPRRLVQPGNVVNFGYENQVLLMARVMPPGDLRAGSEVELAAKVSWLCCKEECIPGAATCSLQLNVGSQAEPTNQPLFEKWSAQVPSAHPADVSKSNMALGADGKVTLTIDWKTPPREMEVFPGPSAALSCSDASIQTVGNSSTITFTITRLAGIDLDVSQLPVVVGYTLADGSRRGLLNEIATAGLRSSGAKP